MNLKKNNISYFAWLLLLFFTGASCAFLGLVLAQRSNMNILLTAGGMVTLFFIVVFGLYLLIGYCLERKEIKPNILQVLNLSQKLELVFLLLIMALGFLIRVLMLEYAGEEAAYFEVCKIIENNSLSIKPVQGSVYFYCLLLHGLYYIFGNKWMTGIWLQIILQLFGAFILLCGLKKVLNKLASYLVLLFILFSPQSIIRGITYSPQILFFCVFAAIFYVIADYIQKSQQLEEHKSFMWIYTIICGLGMGICSYLDLSGFILLFLWCILPMVKRREYTTIWWYRCIAGILVAFVTLFMLLFVDAILSHSSIGNIINAWMILYGNVGFELDVLVNSLNAEFILLVLFSCVGCFSFWRRVNTERFSPFIFMTIGMGILLFGGFTTENMSGTYLMCVLLAMLASVSLTELFCTEDLVRVNTRKNKEMEELEDEKIKKIEFIENPLPVPKKHVRKTMDYAFIPDESQMKYDIHVSDNDDYDLKM